MSQEIIKSLYKSCHEMSVSEFKQAIAAYIDFKSETIHHERTPDCIFEVFKLILSVESDVTEENLYLWKRAVFIVSERINVKDETIKSIISEHAHPPLWAHARESSFHTDTAGQPVISYWDHKDRRVETKLSKFLNKFEPDSGHTEQSLADLQKKFVSEIYDIGITQNPELIAKIYKYGPRSCMGGPSYINNWARTSHPSEAYASPDLGMAYMKKVTSTNYEARALIDLKQRTFVRCYGDTYLIKALNERYQIEFEESRSVSNYTRLKRIPIGETLMRLPYMDFPFAALVDEGDYLRIYNNFKDIPATSLDCPVYSSGNTSGVSTQITRSLITYQRYKEHLRGLIHSYKVLHSNSLAQALDKPVDEVREIDFTNISHALLTEYIESLKTTTVTNLIPKSIPDNDRSQYLQI